jgi:hypothetical protein
MKKHLFLLASLSFILSTVNGQSTFSLVDNLLKANCTIGCHNPSNLSGNLDLTGPETDVFNRLVGAIPTNPAAGTMGMKLVDKGYPRRSYLFKKLNNLLDQDFVLTPPEGQPMPIGASALKNEEIELVRQWILKGAPMTGSVVDTAVINKFYNGKAIMAKPVSNPKPTAPGSFQEYLGRIFLPPLTEAEYFIKHDLRLNDTVEVNRLEAFIPPQSHHFILYKLNPGSQSLFPDGLRLQNPVNGSGSSTGNNRLVSAWQYSFDNSLPAGTAYSWETSTVLDQNIHVRNYNIDSVMATDIYYNIYTQPKGTAQSIMQSDLIINTSIAIPPNNTPTVFTRHDYYPGLTKFWNVYMLSSHTHKLAIDFDIFARNSNGSFGQQLFEGFYNPDYTFNQGYYDWAHPPTRKFDPPVIINPQHGLIQQATYRNPGPSLVTWGLTTNDEMMLYFIQYTIGNDVSTGIENGIIKNSNISVNVYPNPAESGINIAYQMKQSENVSIELIDAIGRSIPIIINQPGIAGENIFTLNRSQYFLASGLYTVRIWSEGYSGSAKLLLIQ